MTEKIGDLVIIKEEKPQQCDYCGDIAELRPYGKNGAAICFKCAMADEKTTEEMCKRSWE